MTSLAGRMARPAPSHARSPGWSSPRPDRSRTTGNAGLAQDLEQARGSGQHLHPSERELLTRRFEWDFSRVRVHADPQADRLVRSLHATALTSGHDIFFRTDAYRPGAARGLRLLAHEAAHCIQQSRLPPAAAMPVGFTTSNPSDHSEREAESAARLIMDHLTQPVSVRAQAGPELVQRNGRLPEAYRVHAEFLRFVDNAERYGLPVKFLRRVGKSYNFGIAFSTDHVNTWLNTLNLEEETLGSVRKFSPELPLGEAPGVLTIYHEATHAYLDLMGDEPAFSQFIRAGEQHYVGAPRAGGEPTSSPSRLFQEAAGSYVGHRAASWWSAFEMLSIYASARGEIPKDRLQSAVQDVRATYDQAMRQMVFGYSVEGAVLGFGGEQVETTRPMTAQMKAFLDEQLLEGKIPDAFDEVAGFRPLIAVIGAGG